MNINKIFDEAQSCTRCYGNDPIYIPFPDPKNGRKNVKLMFINERPGRAGPGETGLVSFDNPDSSARFFKKCFEQLGISRKNIFITNACICCLLNKSVSKQHPTAEQIKNCHHWLGKQINETKPKLIITLGNIALKSIKLYFKNSKALKNFELKKDIGKIIKDINPWIYPLYHTSPQARLTRNAKQQKNDWLKIKRILNEM